jgi:hypothetical protein
VVGGGGGGIFHGGRWDIPRYYPAASSTFLLPKKTLKSTRAL